MQSSRETVDFSVELTLRIIVEIFLRDLDLGDNEIADFYANDQTNWLRCVYNIRLNRFVSSNRLDLYKFNEGRNKFWIVESSSWIDERLTLIENF